MNAAHAGLSDESLFSKSPSQPWSKRIVTVTPEIASRWLRECNLVNYRKASAARVRAYSDLMASGEWIEAHPDGIQFDWNGYIGNGQHRLLALVASGKTLRMSVERGIDPAHFQATDQGIVRTLGDALGFSGFRSDVQAKKAAAVIRSVFEGFENRSVGRAQIVEFAHAHEDRIGTFMLLLRGCKPARSQVTAAFVKASFTNDEDAVITLATRYAEKRFNGLLDPMALLHNRVIQHVTRGGHAIDLYAYAVQAIRVALEGRQIDKLYMASTDFLLPGESEPRKRQEKVNAGLKSWEVRRAKAAEAERTSPADRPELLDQERKAPPAGPPSRPRFAKFEA